MKKGYKMNPIIPERVSDIYFKYRTIHSILWNTEFTDRFELRFTTIIKKGVLVLYLIKFADDTALVSLLKGDEDSHGPLLN